MTTTTTTMAPPNVLYEAAKRLLNYEIIYNTQRINKYCVLLMIHFLFFFVLSFQFHFIKCNSTTDDWKKYCYSSSFFGSMHLKHDRNEFSNSNNFNSISCMCVCVCAKADIEWQVFDCCKSFLLPNWWSACM